MRENVNCKGNTPGAIPGPDASPDPGFGVACEGVRTVVIARMIPS